MPSSILTESKSCGAMVADIHDIPRSKQWLRNTRVSAPVSECESEPLLFSG